MQHKKNLDAIIHTAMHRLLWVCVIDIHVQIGYMQNSKDAERHRKLRSTVGTRLARR